MAFALGTNTCGLSADVLSQAPTVYGTRRHAGAIGMVCHRVIMKALETVIERLSSFEICSTVSSSLSSGAILVTASPAISSRLLVNRSTS